MRRRYAMLPLLVWLSVPVGVRAQENGGGLCWAAHPQPRCGAFLLTNAGLYTGLGNNAGSSAVFDGGFMVNVSGRDAVGVSFLGSIETNSVAGAMAHYRRWLNKDASFEAGLGVPTSGPSGVLGLVKINPVNWIGLALRPRLLRDDYPGAPRHFDASLGLELSGTPAVVGSAVGFVALLIAVANCNCFGN